MSAPQIHLIDGNSVGFAAHMSTQLRTGKKQTQAIFGVIRTLRDLQLRYPGSKKFVLWDGRAQWRYDLFEGYKKRRHENPEMIRMKAEYKAQKPDLERALNLLGFEQVLSPTCEADDLAAAYAFVFSDKGWRTDLISSDMDWYQMVNPLVRWYDPIRDKSLTFEEFEAKTGFRSARQILDAKALAGDSSDCIPGVGAIGKVGAKKLLDRFGRVPTFLKQYDDDPHSCGDLPKAWVQLAENFEGRRERYHRNFKLMELKPGLPGTDRRISTKGEFNPDEFARLCEELAFFSILDRFDEWTLPFRSKE